VRRDPGLCHLALSLHAPDVAPYCSIKVSMLGMPRFLRIQSLPAGSPGNAQGWFHDLRLQYNTPHGRGGSHRGVNLSELRWLP